MRRIAPEASRNAPPLQLDIDRREALVGGTPIPLTDKEYAILELLVLAGGRPVCADAIGSRLFGSVCAPGPIITFHLCRLLKKLTRARARPVIGAATDGSHAFLSPHRTHPGPAGGARAEPEGLT
jgi:DNA-binding response OmpR family regulator